MRLTRAAAIQASTGIAPASQGRFKHALNSRAGICWCWRKTNQTQAGRHQAAAGGGLDPPPAGTGLSLRGPIDLMNGTLGHFPTGHQTCTSPGRDVARPVRRDPNAGTNWGAGLTGNDTWVQRWGHTPDETTSTTGTICSRIPYRNSRHGPERYQGPEAHAKQSDDGFDAKPAGARLNEQFRRKCPISWRAQLRLVMHPQVAKQTTTRANFTVNKQRPAGLCYSRKVRCHRA